MMRPRDQWPSFQLVQRDFRYIKEIFNLDAQHAHIVFDPRREKAFYEFAYRKVYRMERYLDQVLTQMDDQESKTDGCGSYRHKHEHEREHEHEHTQGGSSSSSSSSATAEPVHEPNPYEWESLQAFELESSGDYDFVSIDGYDVVFERFHDEGRLEGLSQTEPLHPPSFGRYECFEDFKRFRTRYVEYFVRMQRRGQKPHDLKRALGAEFADVIASLQHYQFTFAQVPVDEDAKDGLILRDIDEFGQMLDERMNKHERKMLQRSREKKAKEDRQRLGLENGRANGKRHGGGASLLCRNCGRPGHFSKTCSY